MKHILIHDRTQLSCEERAVADSQIRDMIKEGMLYATYSQDKLTCTTDLNCVAAKVVKYYAHQRVYYCECCNSIYGRMIDAIASDVTFSGILAGVHDTNDPSAFKLFHIQIVIET